MPLIAGLSFEVIKFAGKNRRRRWVRALMWPGMQLQLLTTREPDLDQLAVAIAAMEAVLAVEDPMAATEEAVPDDAPPEPPLPADKTVRQSRTR